MGYSGKYGIPYTFLYLVEEIATTVLLIHVYLVLYHISVFNFFESGENFIILF